MTRTDSVVEWLLRKRGASCRSTPMMVAALAVALVAGALGACKRTPATVEPVAPEVAIEQVTVNGKAYRQWTFRDRLVRVPADVKTFSEAFAPHWWLPLFGIVPTFGTEDREGYLYLTLRPAPRPYPDRPIETHLRSAAQISAKLIGTYPELGLARYASESAAPTTPQVGLMVPLDHSFRSPDGLRPVIQCHRYLGEHFRFTRRNQCWFRGQVSEQISFSAEFYANALPQWRTIHDIAWQQISESVINPGEGKP